MDLIDRRGFLGMLGLGVSATVVASLPTSYLTRLAVAAQEPAAIVGTVVGKSPGALRLGLSHGGARDVAVTSATRMYSGIYGRVGSADDFILGDRVLSVGRWRGATLIADDVGTAFAPLAFTVERMQRAPLAAHTQLGPVDLTGMNLPDVGHVGLDPSGLAPGMSVDGLGWRDPRDATLYLVTGSVA